MKPETILAIIVGCILFVTTNYFCNSTVQTRTEAQPTEGLTSTGFEAVLSFNHGLTLYHNGEVKTEKQWQKLLSVKQDGKIGYRTIQQAIGFNNTNVRGLK